MRVTNSKIARGEKREIGDIVDGNVLVDDFTLSTDFAEDLLGLLKAESRKSAEFKDFWKLFGDIKDLYTKYQLGDLMKNVRFYNGDVKPWMERFIESELFKELDKLEPMDALKLLLEMFKPEQQEQEVPGMGGQGNKDGDPQGSNGNSKGDNQGNNGGKDSKQGSSDKGQGTGGSGKGKDGTNQDVGNDQDQSQKQDQGQQNGKDQTSSGNRDGQQGDGSQKEWQGGNQRRKNKRRDSGDTQDNNQSPSRRNTKDQRGLSADRGSAPLDMESLEDKLDKIDNLLKAGILDRKDFREHISGRAGVGVADITLSNIGDIVDKISRTIRERDLDIFYVARKQESTDVYRRDEVLESVELPDNEMSVKQMERHQEILKILPAQWAYPDDIFNEKLLKKELQVRDYQSRRLKKQALYILVDVSGSMEGGCDAYAAGTALSLVRQAVEEKSVYFLRFFDMSPKELITVTTKEEAGKLADILLNCPFSGGGTNINRALQKAVEDITTYPDKFEKMEIMLITDGEDHVTMSKKDLKDVKLHSVVLTNDNPPLKKLSDTYIMLNYNEIRKEMPNSYPRQR